MNRNEKQLIGVVLLWVARIIIIIKAGIFAWDWIEPDSFFDAIKFLFAWVIIFFIAELIISAIIAMIFND